MSSYHISNFGSMASQNLLPDLDGYVHLDAESVLNGHWDALAEMTDERAEEIAEQNRQATESSDSEIAEWRAE